MRTLGIETSCDDTSAGVVDGVRVESNVVSSQIANHSQWGGVVPMLAKREHHRRIEFVLAKALGFESLAKELHSQMEGAEEAEGEHVEEGGGIKLNLAKSRMSYDETNPERVGEVDISRVLAEKNPGLELIAVTQGPGLAPSLEIGLEAAKNLAHAWGLQLVATNHMEGHFWSARLENEGVGEGLGGSSEGSAVPEEYEFPVLGLLVSGGHTDIHYSASLGSYELLGKTVDDAAGEAFDKVSVMLGLGYPGGKALEELAAKGQDPDMFELPVPMRASGDLNFSFAGLKTAALYKLQELEKKYGQGEEIPREVAANFAAKFQQVVVESIIIKLRKAIELKSVGGRQVKSLYVGGGVVNNSALVASISELCEQFGVKLMLPRREFLLDNGAMIALAGQIAYEQGRGVYKSSAGQNLYEGLDRKPEWKLIEL
ncbi:MAG: tRNA (adenosine(37)-N6)-threonylcarbamoyltransferase complex transferase subunit TsaD [Candidatus Dojkabacteria bacterium]